ncbi:hypothetical protein H6F43_21080 [Leptolyngbya sp. FACHB-36]|uniref:hypothetical protein n=1 Tax=Leptolyngbya sp. FACHB-36 TaxID=2692808 RepID=UPI0016811243|nr:hypothetical protein [Leptolyngbya sp. FACHB-36]MBD2022681.1 hypothetical protein [Leptolyngbya sp. FACHB-36]
MEIRYKSAIVALGIALLSPIAASTVMAQTVFTVPAPTQRGSIPNQVEDAFFSNGRDFYQNRSVPRQISILFGPGIIIRNSFPENEIARDGNAINTLYRELLANQFNSGPLIRTVDLPSPFTESLRTAPPSTASVPPPSVPPIFTPTPPSTLSQPRGPIPALW